MNDSQADQEVRASDEAATARRASLLNLTYQDSRGWSGRVELLKDVLSVSDMKSLHVVPIELDTGRMTLAITTTTAQPILQQMRSRFPEYHLNFLLISESGFKELMLRHDPPKAVHYDDIAIQTEGASQTLEEVSRTLETVRPDDILDYLITQAERLHASDIHFENEKDSVRMRFRVDGTLHAIARLSKDKYRQLSGALAIRANVSVAAPEAQTGHLTHEFDIPGGHKTLNMRIETVPTTHGQDAVLRLFSIDRELMKLESLGLSEQHKAEIDELIRHPHGLVLAVGPTGSGKTTTLYSILERLNQTTRKIITLEDPVEYNFEGVTQIPVKANSGDQSFADNLRAVLRLDPDVIMIGEIRDVDTARTALQAALTGHLVLSTFHAVNAAAALTRMLDTIGDNPLFAGALRLVLAQRLVRRLDDTTKQPYQADERLAHEIAQVLSEMPDGIAKPDISGGITLYRPGTSNEAPFGFVGRMMIAEQLRITPQIQAVLRQDPAKVDAETIQKIAQEQGMLTLLQDGVLKALAGLTSIEEVYQNVDL